MRDKVVLITGGARGLGAGLAARVISNGGKVYLIDVSGDAVSSQVSALGESNAAGCAADVTDWASLEEAFQNCHKQWGRIDAVVANAGILRLGTIENMPLEEFNQVIQVNVNGVFHTIRAAVPYLRETKGYLQVISSLAAAIHAPLMAHYAASKAAAEALADVARQELAPDGIDVGCVHPTFAKTDMIKENDTGRLYGGHRGAFGAVEPELVIEAMYKGLVNRSRKVIAPKMIAPLVLAPGLFHKATEVIGHLYGTNKTLARIKEEELSRRQK